MTSRSLVQRIIDCLLERLPEEHRFVIAIAGPPAAGKTTLADAELVLSRSTPGDITC